MDSWPVDERTQPLATETGRKGQTKSKQTATAPNYPDLERGANAVTLVERDGQLDWAAIVKSGHQGQNHLRMGRYSAIFPVTRPMLDRQMKTTILHQAERGANFLRTFLPEVDIPAELIRDEVARDAAIARKLELYDPYMGNLLEPVVTTDSTFLAFPMGELNRDLNLSPFLQSENGAVFKPSGRPTRTFDTPIRQISASQTPGVTSLQSSYLAVRTFGLTSLLEVNTSKTTPYLAEMATILHADTDNRALVDIRLLAQPFEALAVTDHGSVYRCSVFSGQKNLNVIHSRNLNANGDAQDSFWRLSLGVHGVNYLLASKHSLTQFDLRTNNFQELFSLPGQRDVLTCVEDQGDDYIVKLCSTRDILWIDARFPGKPLLSYKHGRQYDRYLDVWTSPLSPASTLLTSRCNAMVTVYDVSRSEGQLIRINAPPYCFIPGHDARASHLGHALFKNPLDTNPEAFSLIRLGEQGSLSQIDFRTSAARPASVFEMSWTTDVKQLKSRPLRTKAALSEDQEFIETDLSSAYDHNGQERGKAEKEHASAVYDLLETIPRFWQKVEAPVEHMLTTSDVAFRAGDELIQATRADFLTESVINSTSGYRAMAQGRLSPAGLVKGAAWHYNIAPILQRFDSTFAGDIQNCTKALSQHNLAEDPARSAQSFKYEKEAREQLALDLALSADVFSSQPFSKSSDEDLELEAMTKTLSLAGEPPAVEFGYLRPQASDHYNKEKEKHEVVLSMGVRSLLKDWEIGADPEDFTFADHYDENAPAPQQTRRVRPIQKAENISQLAGAQSQRPPVIVAASTVRARPPEIGRRMLAAQSRSMVLAPPRMVGSRSQVPLSNLPQSSQEYMTSTQILPGVHGGRPPMLKKKVGKKRVGGF